MFLSGRAHGRPLRPGLYVLSAVTGGRRGTPRSATISARFRVLAAFHSG